MTDLKDAARQALKVLEVLAENAEEECGEETCHDCQAWRPVWATIAALKAVLEQPERAQRMRDAGFTRRPTIREMAALEQPNECRWLQEGDEESDTWAASCGRHRYFSLNEGTPKDNHMKHCCYCGKPLVEVPIEEGEV